jgi:hypothetical protein
MSTRLPRLALYSCALFSLIEAAPALATFHLMQIERIIGGVNGDASAQAIQLRMRSPSQGFLRGARIRVHDAAGLNPVLIFDFASCPISTCVPNSSSGSRVLLTSTAFNSLTTPTSQPDFTMTNLIPESYLAAGSMTFETDTGLVYWRVSWGGTAYAGACTGTIDNDADGNFCPPFAGPLPGCGLLALAFTGSFGAASTNNAAQYALTAKAAVFTNNAGTAFTLDASLAGPGGVDFDGDVDLIDFDLFGPCLGGPDAPHLGCDCLDADSDGDIDLIDVAEFQAAFRSSG